MWNKHPNDARHLAEHISASEGWPKLVTWQIVDIQKSAKEGRLSDLQQSPILYMSSDESLVSHLNDKEIAMLKEYVLQGGFIFIVRNCKSEGFDAGSA